MPFILLRLGRTAELPKLKGLELHSTVILSEVDRNTLKGLGINVTEEPVNYQKRLYFKG